MTAERPTNYRTADFDYQLPPELIAQTPLPDRAASRLLIVRRSRETLEDGVFRGLVDLIPPGDLLVINTSRVRHARFLGRRASGAPAEVLLIHPASDDCWIALGRPGSALRPGKGVELSPDVTLEVVSILTDGNRLVRFVGATAQEAIDRFGSLPLPPYIARTPTAADAARYQTVYAEREGSVAAPTAGLHFTAEILSALRDRGIGVGRLDLEIGPGTFKPVDVEDLTRHKMHPESYEIPEALAGQIARVRAGGRAVWAVGTTVVRALESSAVRGVVRAGRGETQLMITPGYPFAVVDHVITNFHLPRSTLLMLVSAFAGVDRTRAAYAHAIAEQYRFYSYGDAMVVV